MVELLKRWLRTQASSNSISEEELRSLSGLCRDTLNHPTLFPSRNPRSFMKSLAEVYDHLQWQLRDVLEKDRTCAELAQRVLIFSKNFLSDSLIYLLLAPTDLKQTDNVASLEVVALWQSLPTATNPLPSRADPSLQKTMKDAWRTRCGTLSAALLSTPWCVRLFDGAGAQEEASAAAAATSSRAALTDASKAGDAPAPTPRDPGYVPALVAAVRAEFDKGTWKNSGLTGTLRRADMRAARENYFEAVEGVCDLAYLLGEVLVQFHKISDGLGDYGMIRVSTWLHPFLEALVEKVQRLRGSLQHLNETLERKNVLAKAKGQKVDSPTPSESMSKRAHDAIARAMTGHNSHCDSLLKTLDDLRARSAPDRLPHLVDGLGDACTQLQVVMSSPEFRARVGDAFPDLPALVGIGGASPGIAPTIMHSVAAPLALLDSPRGGHSSADEAIDDDEIAAKPLTPAVKEPTAASVIGPRKKEVLAVEPVTVSDAVVAASHNPFDDDVEESTPATIMQDLKMEPAARSGTTTPTTLADLPAISDADAAATASDTCSGRSSVASTAFRSSVTSDDASSSQFGSRRRTFSTPTRFWEMAERCAPATTSMVRGRSPAAAGSGDFLPTTTAPRGRLSETHGADGEELLADVYRLTTAVVGHGWRRHDRRSLRLWRGCLHIYSKGSSKLVKAVVDVKCDVDSCTCLSPLVLSLVMRKREPSVASQGTELDIATQKLYFFEFASADTAAAFHAEIQRLRQ
jgi:hypothetical protein